jgi:hypothetical protein
VLEAPVHVYEYDPDVFMSIQIDENNLRRDVKPERHAKAVTEIYRYGELLGRWKSATEFAQASAGKLTPRLVQDALAFANLPLFARNYVYEGDLRYSIGVTLGRAVVEVRRLYATRPVYQGHESYLQDDVDTWINAAVAHIVNTKEIRGVINAQRYIRQRVEDLRVMIEGLNNDFSLVSPEEVWEEYQRGKRKECVAAWQEYLGQSPTRALSFIELAGGYVKDCLVVEQDGLKRIQELQHELELARREIASGKLRQQSAES